jgi:hypothetical protein
MDPLPPPEKRKLQSYVSNLSAEQIFEKDRLIEIVNKSHPEISSYMTELCIDFCIRNPEEATRVRESKEWEEVESMHSPANLQKIMSEYNNNEPRDIQ